MSDPSTLDVAPLATLIEALSVDAINIQLMFDHEHVGDLVRFGEALTGLTAALGSSAAGLLPPRLQLRTHEVRTRVRVAVDRTHGFAVKVLPLNLGYDLRYGTTATQESRISICVARVPPRAAPPGAPD